MNTLWADSLRAAAVLAALCLSAASLLAFTKKLRWGGPATSHTTPPRPSFTRLASFSIDPSRRLTLIELDGSRAVLLTGGKNDVMLPWPAAHPKPPAP